MKNLNKNISIGIFLIISIIVVIWGLLYLSPSTGDGRLVIYTRFINIDNIAVGTRVSFAGKPVGEVFEIKMISDGRSLPKGKAPFVYTYELTLKLDSSIAIYPYDEITAHTTGLMGERSIAITPRPHRDEKALLTESIMYARPTGSIEETVEDLTMLSSKVNMTIDEVYHIIHNNSEAIDGILKNINASSEDMYSIISKVNSIDLIDNINATVENTRLITDKLVEGKGNLGKLLQEEDIYFNITTAMNKFDTLMNDINHYGLLFHLDKSWQRQRLQRINLLKELQTPQQFQEYFDDEIDNISTSLSRLSMLISKTSQPDSKISKKQDKEFIDSFNAVLKRIDSLNESLGIYKNMFIEK